MKRRNFLQSLLGLIGLNSIDKSESEPDGNVVFIANETDEIQEWEMNEDGDGFLQKRLK